MSKTTVWCQQIVKGIKCELKDCFIDSIHVFGLQEDTCFVKEEVEHMATLDHLDGTVNVIFDPWNHYPEYNRYLVGYKKEVEAEFYTTGGQNMPTKMNTDTQFTFTLAEGTTTANTITSAILGDTTLNYSNIFTEKNSDKQLTFPPAEGKTITNVISGNSSHLGDIILNHSICAIKDCNTMPVYDQEMRGIRFLNIKEIVPGKVVEVDISEETFWGYPVYTYKQVCKDPDVFDMRMALALAYVKYLNGGNRFGYKLTPIGVEMKAREMLETNADLIKEINRALKAYKKWLDKKAKEEAEETERKAVITRRQEKNKRRKEKMRAKKRQDEIDVIVDAIKAAKG